MAKAQTTNSRDSTCHLWNPHYKIVFYTKEGNNAADRIANEAFSIQNHVSKLYSIVPDWLKLAFETDMTDVSSNNVG